MTVTHERPRGLLSLLSVAVVIGLVSLVLAIQNAVALNAQSDQRELDRLASDYAACLRGNVFREQIVAVGGAQEGLVQGIIDTVFVPTGSPERQAAIEAAKAKFDPLFDDYETQLSEIKPNNCDQVVPGGADALDKASQSAGD